MMKINQEYFQIQLILGMMSQSLLRVILQCAIIEKKTNALLGN